MQKNKKIILIIGIIVIIVLALILLLVPSAKKVGAPNQNLNNSSTTASNGAAGSGAIQSPTATSVPSNVVVPNKGDKNVPSNVAVPQTQTDAAPGVSAQLRTYSISANNNTFTPNTVIAKIGDTINISITAVDKNYDFSQPDNGLLQSIPKGQTRLVAMSPMSVGKFTFFCPSCGGPSKGPIGYIIVTAN